MLVGHCVNFLPIRGGWDRTTTFADHLRAVGKQVLDAYEHQDYTLGTLVRKLALPRAANRLPLTEIQFNLERLADNLHAAGLDIAVEPNPKAYVNFDMFWNVIESEDGLRIDCDYNTRSVRRGDDRPLARMLRGTAGSDSRGCDSSGDARYHTCRAAERHRLVTELNATATDYPRDRRVDELIEERAAAQPEAQAVIFRPDGAELSRARRTGEPACASSA